MLPSPFAISRDQRQKRSLTQDVIPFLNNITFQYTNPLSFEAEPRNINTIPLLREHCDSYLYYFRYKTTKITHSQNPFQIIFNPVHGINPGTHYRTIHTQNINLSIQDVFITYMDKLTEHDENLDTLIYIPFHLESVKEKHEYFEVQYCATKISRHDNPHYWLQQDILQSKQFKTDSFETSNLTKIQYHKKSLLTFSIKIVRI